MQFRSNEHKSYLCFALEPTMSFRMSRLAAVSLIASISLMHGSAGIGSTHEETALPIVYVMDSDRAIVQRLSLADGSGPSSAKFDRRPAAMMLNPNKSRLLVFDTPKWAKGFAPEDAGFMRPSTQQTLTILDAHDLKVVGKIENLGWNAAPIRREEWSVGHVLGAWDPTGERLTILCLGRKGHSSELVQVDVPSARIVGRISLESDPEDVSAPMIMPGEEEAALLYGSKIGFFSLRTLSDIKEIPLSGRGGVVLSCDKSKLYVIGRRNSVNAVTRIYVISLNNHVLDRTIEAGFDITDTLTDMERDRTLFAVAERSKGGSRLLVLHGKDRGWKSDFRILRCL